jgi:hypothetical protein
LASIPDDAVAKDGAGFRMRVTINGLAGRTPVGFAENMVSIVQFKYMQINALVFHPAM